MGCATAASTTTFIPTQFHITEVYGNIWAGWLQLPSMAQKNSSERLLEADCWLHNSILKKAESPVSVF